MEVTSASYKDWSKIHFLEWTLFQIFIETFWKSNINKVNFLRKKTVNCSLQLKYNHENHSGKTFVIIRKKNVSLIHTFKKKLTLKEIRCNVFCRCWRWRTEAKADSGRFLTTCQLFWKRHPGYLKQTFPHPWVVGNQTSAHCGVAAPSSGRK